MSPLAAGPGRGSELALVHLVHELDRLLLLHGDSALDELVQTEFADVQWVVGFQVLAEAGEPVSYFLDVLDFLGTAATGKSL